MKSNQSHKPHMIFDAIHHVMEIHKSIVDDKTIHAIKKIIDSPYFQRLKGIKQLGLADMVFPTATHTRFSHSTGTAYLASLIIKQLKEAIHKKDYLNIIISALLHDIGHGPFSHTFEEFLSNYFCIRIKHESWAKKFIEEFVKEGILSNKTASRVNEILFPPSIEKQSILSDIISSQLDCDRLDYLLRDSHFCGVTYGTFDLEWLLHCMVVVYPKNSSPKLGISHKGIGAVENYLIGRRLMYSYICQNKNIIGFTDNLNCFLLALSKWIESEKSEDKRKIIGTQLFEFLKIINLCKKKNSNEETIINQTFSAYKYLTDHDIWYAIRNIFLETNKKKIPSYLQKIAASFLKRKSPKVIEIKKNLERREERIKDYIQAHNLDDSPFIINIIKPPFSTYDTDNSEIYVQEDENVYKLQDKSLIINRLLGQKEEKMFLKIESEYYAKNAEKIDQALKI